MKRTPNAGRNLRDLKAAALMGVATEALLAILAFDLVGRHPWLEMSQMPGAQIAERVFNHSGLPTAVAFALIFQAALFTVLILGITYACRLLSGWGRSA